MNGKRKYCQGINLKQEYNLICTVTTHPYLKEMRNANAEAFFRE